MKNSILFNLKLNDTEIDQVGKKGRSFLKSHGFTNDTVQAQIMILKELINNGKQFEKTSAPNDEITVFFLVEEKPITVEIRKPVKESNQHQLNDLDKTIQLIRGY